jgi:hypothetical protein
MDDPVIEPEDLPEVIADPWEGPEADAIRDERNSRLSACDWKVLPDSPFQRDMGSRAALWIYRKSLRDITNAFASPADVVWPEEPSI